MLKLLQALRPIVKASYHRPFTILVICIFISIIAASYALKLGIDTDIANLLPPTNPTVQALEKLQETSGGETEMQVAIKSPSFEANVRFAEDLIEESLKLYDPGIGDYFFKRAEFRRETEVLKDNALYLATIDELEDVTAFLEDEIRQAKEEASPFFIDFGDEFDDEEDEDNRFENFERAYNEIIPSEYPVNEDSTLVTIKFFPTGSKSNIRYLEDMFSAYDSLVTAMEPASYHPEMEVKFGGRLKRHLNEFESIMNDVFSSFALGISSVIFLVLLYFFIKKYIHYRKGARDTQDYTFWSHLIRAPIPVFVIGVPLVISLTWTFGITHLFLDNLNTMTSVLFVILFGLGIDYGIHYYARYIELRSSGMDVFDSIMNAYERTGLAIFVSAVTTASALFVLMFAEFRGFSEFGFISGLGIILALLSMLYILPALLTLFERYNLILFNTISDKNQNTNFIKRYPFTRTIVVCSTLLCVIVLVNVHYLRFEYDFGKLEPEFEEYQQFRDFTRGIDESERRNPAYIIADSNEDVFELLDSIRVKKEGNPESLINSYEALQERIPPTEELQQRKLEYLANIRRLLQDPFIVDREDESLDILRRGSATTEPLDVDKIPDFLKNRFLTRDGEIGKFVIIYPEGGMSDSRRSIAFKSEIGKITLQSGKTYHAGSTSLVAAEMIDLMRAESPYMIAATFVMIFILMYFSFGSIRWTLIALMPLIIGLIWLFGIMLVFGLKFNFYNLVVLPAILGIGVDNGA
ncbi:MAG: RND family transporter, partial [Balneolaceae bacterium]